MLLPRFWGSQVYLEGGAFSQLLSIRQKYFPPFLFSQILHDLNFEICKLTFQSLLMFVVVGSCLLFADNRGLNSYVSIYQGLRSCPLPLCFLFQKVIVDSK